MQEVLLWLVVVLSRGRTVLPLSEPMRLSEELPPTAESGRRRNWLLPRMRRLIAPFATEVEALESKVAPVPLLRWGVATVFHTVEVAS